jgi:hypothetical protein
MHLVAGDTRNWGFPGQDSADCGCSLFEDFMECGPAHGERRTSRREIGFRKLTSAEKAHAPNASSFGGGQSNSQPCQRGERIWHQRLAASLIDGRLDAIGHDHAHSVLPRGDCRR